MESINNQLQTIFGAHAKMKESNPMLTETQWDIKDIPYKELKEWKNAHNDKNEDHETRMISWGSLGARHVYIGLHSWMIPEMPDGCYIRMHSTEVKKVVTVEVIED